MRSERGEVTRREIETPAETRFNVTSGPVHHAPNQDEGFFFSPSERASCKLNPVNVNNIVVKMDLGIGLMYRGCSEHQEREFIASLYLH